MSLTDAELSRYLPHEGEWPDWVLSAPYVGAAHPYATDPVPLERGANCQRYAYAVVALFDRTVEPHWSSELWEDRSLDHVSPSEMQDLDIVLFNATDEAWGAHVAVFAGGKLLHLSAEEGLPALWDWADFASRDRYSHVVGIVRPQ